VTALLKKVNEISTLLKQLTTKETKQLIKYNKTNLIETSDDSAHSSPHNSNSSSESEDPPRLIGDDP